MSTLFKAIWCNADPIPKGDIVARANRYFRQRPYTGAVGTGFIVGTVSRSRLEATFVVRSVIEEQVVDPVSGPTTITRMTLAISDFILSNRAPHLEIVAPNRTTRILLTELTQNVVQESAFVRASFDFETLLLRLREDFGDVNVVGVETEPFYVNGRTLAQAQFRSLYDVSSDVAEVLAKYKYSITAIRACITKLPSARLEFNKGGKLTVSTNVGMDLFNDIRQCVRKYFCTRAG